MSLKRSLLFSASLYFNTFLFSSKVYLVLAIKWRLIVINNSCAIAFHYRSCSNFILNIQVWWHGWSWDLYSAFTWSVNVVCISFEVMHSLASTAEETRSVVRRLRKMNIAPQNNSLFCNVCQVYVSSGKIFVLAFGRGIYFLLKCSLYAWGYRRPYPRIA